MSAADYEKLADRLDQEVQEMERRTERLGDDAEQAREDWEHKRADPSVPGAPSPEEGSSEERSPDSSEGEPGG